MNKPERLAAAQKAMNDIDEGNPSLICSELASEFDLPYDEVSRMYWGPLQEAYACSRRQNVGACHYCGMPAQHFNFFDVPVCDNCE